jgi:hypothetical protein
MTEPASEVFDEDYQAVYAEFYTLYFNQFVRAILRAVREGSITSDQIHEVRYSTSLVRIRDAVPHLITPEQVRSGLSKIAANENAREMALSSAIVATKELLGE